MEDPLKGVKELTNIEALAEEILRDKSEIVALDKRRNSNREGLRAVSKLSDNKVWMTVGPILVKLPTSKAKGLLQKDQTTTETEINIIRSELKVKVNKLRDLEYKDPIPGFSLKALNRSEFSAVAQALGIHS